ncbi:MAG: tryptophan synthase subunit alpha [Xanthomonadales bacterium]|nr:Tryptophan synthase alpha chain [Xanthomonadales bacterium]MCC6591635.1 tryptophan synthase subunit alpha [Xanthomonadales bacterium]MCE7930071.1 tryptophan synthase subunit alpha [Xanthomonadales bacterium PRO6]
MPNRIDTRFAALRAAGRPGLITFTTAGDPDPALTVDVLHALVRHGADLVELGMPFSDPMADGPVIQQANERALARHVGLAHVLEALRGFRASDADTPVVLMGYLNPIERYGFERFAVAAAAAGADGLLLVDCPIEESAGYEAVLQRLGLHQVYLLAPTTPPERRSRIAAKAGGFLYYVSFKGITGAGHLETAQAMAALDELRGLSQAPLAVGFGIRDAATAALLGAHAQAIVIGSVLVERLADARDASQVDAAVASCLPPIRDALHALRGG